MNILRKIRKKREKTSTEVAPKDRNQYNEPSAGPKADEGQHFSTLEEAKLWVEQNREDVTPIKYDPGYVAQKYLQPSLTLEEGASLHANSGLYPTQFKYHRLQGRNIRLLVLRSGKGYDPLRCQLQETSLDSPISYQALSYTWGDPIPRYQIECNKATIFIALNLHRALWEFRELELLGPFWIDAVCINQTDLEEKTEQIKMMRSVYERAAVVRIWLGEASNVTGTGVALLKQAYYAMIKKNQKEPDPAEAYISLTSFGLGDRTVDEIATLWYFYVSHWFDRSWVVQELAVAAKAVFHVGTYEIEAEMVLHVTAMLSKTLLGSLSMEASRPWSKIESLKPFRFPASVFADVRLQYSKGTKLTLAEILRCTAQLKATEPRDKIFAFIGLASDGDLSMINYSTSLRDLHLSISKNALLSGDGPGPTGLDFLSLVRTYLDTRTPVIENVQQINQLGLDSMLSSQDLPSWAPDLTHHDDFFGDSIVPLASVFSSCSILLTTRPEVHLVENEILAVRGKVLDIAHDFFESFPYRFPVRFTVNKATADELLDLLAEWPLQCRKFIKNHNLFTEEGGHITEPTFARTVAFNSAFGDNYTFRSFDWRYYKSFQAWCVVLGLIAKGHRSNVSKTNLYAAAAEVVNNGFNQSLSAAAARGEPHAPVTPDITPADVLSYTVTFDKLARGRKFGITQRGLMGWFPECTRNGDVVCLFDGCRIPFVLRLDANREAYKIVGDSCLHELMHEDVFREVERQLKGVRGGLVKIC